MLMKEKEFVFGPVPSRRLGFSLGVDIIPRKHCTFDCIYCQVGKTTAKDVERRSFVDPDLVVKQVIERVAKGGRIDFVSLSGSGEPTLNADIGGIIAALKRRISIPLAVITNGSLLFLEDVRRDLSSADVVLPSLDAASDEVFERINRPHPSLSLSRIVEGLKAFASEYRGKVWLELMLIKNINDASQEVEMLRQIVRNIPADKIHLNTVARPPLEETAMGLERAEMESIARRFGTGCEVIGSFKGPVATASGKEWEESLVDTVKRRSLSAEDVVRTTGLSLSEAKERLDRLMRAHKLKATRFGGKLFYTAEEEKIS